MRTRKSRRGRKAAFPDRQIIAKAQGRFAKADKQVSGMKANPKREVAREQHRIKRIKSHRPKAPSGKKRR
ncbi:MAG: hypothetical protein ACREEL_10155 [Stellaceae bacterium]